MARLRTARRSTGRLLAAPLAGALALATLGGLASTARADVRTEARRHFREGMALIAEGEVDDGIAELREAYEILPHPNVLYNIGRAYAESGSYAEAIEYFERYLESDPPDRVEVMGFLSALRARIQAVEEREGGAPAQAEPETTEPTEQTASVASEEEIAALEDSATQIEALAESAQSEALRQRAVRLRELADALRERRVAAREGTPVGEGPARGEAESPAETAAEGEAAAEGEEELVLGEEREGDTYEERVVSSSRAAQSPLEAPNSTTNVTAQDIRLSGLTNPGETLRRVAGVELMLASPGDVQLSIRGLNQRLSNRAIVLVDGRSVYLDFLGTTLWSLLPLAVEDIERIEVIRGPASALYGADAFTGIVNIITRPIGEGRSFVSAGIGNQGQYRLASTVTERIDRLRFRVGGGYDRANVYSRAVGPDRVDVRPFADDPDLGYSRLYFHGDVQLRIADGYTLTAGTGLATGDRSFQGVSRLRELYLQDALFSQTYVQARTAFGLSGRVFWNRFRSDYGLVGVRQGGIEEAQTGTVDRQDVVDAELVYQNRFDIVEGLNNQIIAGVGYRFKEIDWSWIADPITGQQQIQTQHHFNVFLQDTLRIEEAVQVVLSARLDRHPLLDDPQISPRGSVVVHPTPRQSIRLTAGTAFRSPTFVESYVFVPNSTPLRGVTAFGVGNQNLAPERIVSVELGYMLQETDWFALELNGYYNLVFDQILLSQNTAFRLSDFAGGRPGADYDPELEAFPLGQLQFANEEADYQQIGGEIGVRIYPVDGLDVYANYAIHETSPLDDQATGGLTDDQRTSLHKVNAGVQYRSPFGLDLSVDFHFVSDQVWVEQVLDTERGGTRFQRFPLDAYAVLNARVGYRLFDDQLELSVVGTNLLMEHREHPFGQVLDRRIMGHVTVRF
ncbi:MAG TPA: TonB-dependent receptor [Sandaracinaceae bacterium LLY-WYZ-13_1]|nr:TonB-dependent receptor [Sandaracinaceae bacterium LLY-WYZ-13_1]